MSRKVSILIHSLTGGGAERVVSLLVNHMNHLGYSPSLVFLFNDIKYEINKEVECVYLSKMNRNQNMLINLLKLPYFAYKYSQFLKKNNISLSLSFLPRPNYINVISNFFWKKSIIIINERSYPSQEYAGFSIKSIINKLLIITLYRKSNLVVTNSLGNAIDLSNNFYVDKLKIKTLYNPIDLDKINNCEVIDDFYDKNYVNFITVGRVDRNKNQDFLIEVIHSLKRSDVKLYIVGEGVLKNHLIKKVDKLGLKNNIIFVGHVKNPYKYMKGADAFLFSSKSEGFPNVLLEAIACGLPVITHNCKSGPDEIFFNEVLSVSKTMRSDLCQLVPYDDFESFVKAINYYINNKKQFQVENKVRSEFLEKFNKDKILTEYIELINSKIK